MTEDSILLMISEERSRQDKKWGFPQQNNFAEWACILAEEVGELQMELNEAHFRTSDKDKVITEAIHVAAVAVSIIEHYEVAEDIKHKYIASMLQGAMNAESKNKKAESKEPHYAIRGCFNCKGSLYPDCDEDCKRRGGKVDLWRYATHPDLVKITIRRKKS